MKSLSVTDNSTLAGYLECTYYHEKCTYLVHISEKRQGIIHISKDHFFSYKKKCEHVSKSLQDIK